MVSSFPPISVLIRGGSNDSTTMPTSQNQLTTNAPHHNLESACKCRIVARVEGGMLASIFSWGAPSPVAGMSNADIQQASAKLMTRTAKVPVSLPRDARPAAIVPRRMATKVAPSISALPDGNCSRRRWSGRMPYLIGPNSAARTPNANNATKRIGKDDRAYPSTANAAMNISANFNRGATFALSKRSASWPPSADRKKKGAMKAALASVISASESALSDWNRMTKTSAVLRKLSLNAAKNWHQNSGANRLDNSRGDGMPSHYCKVPYGLPEKNQAALWPPD